MNLGHQRLNGARSQPGRRLRLALGAVWCGLAMLAFPMSSHATEEPDFQGFSRSARSHHLYLLPLCQ